MVMPVGTCHGGGGCGSAVEMVESLGLLAGDPVERATVLLSRGVRWSRLLPAGGGRNPREGELPSERCASREVRSRHEDRRLLRHREQARFRSSASTGSGQAATLKQPSVRVWESLPVVYKPALTEPLRASVNKGTNRFRLELDAKAEALSRTSPPGQCRSSRLSEPTSRGVLLGSLDGEYGLREGPFDAEMWNESRTESSADPSRIASAPDATSPGASNTSLFPGDSSCAYLR